MDNKISLSEDCLKKCPLIIRLFELLENIDANLELKVAIEEELLQCLCPIEPPPGAECQCFATGGGTAILPQDSIPAGARGNRASLGFNACPACNFQANITFSTRINNQTQTLFGRNLISLACQDNNTIAIIESSGTFGTGTARQDVFLTLIVNEVLNTFQLTIRNLAGIIIFDTGANPVPLTGQGIEIRPCPL